MCVSFGKADPDMKYVECRARRSMMLILGWVMHIYIYMYIYIFIYIHLFDSNIK